MKVAVAGCGRMGNRLIQVVRNMGLELSGVCDLKAEAVDAVAKEHQLKSNVLFKTYEEMLVGAKAELVVVATTAPVHASYTIQAARAGATHILCEKPMATSLEDCDKMIEACKASGTKLAVNHQMRFMEQYQSPKKLLNSPEFGGLRSINVISGNFGAAMNGVHYFEMFRYMTDEEPHEVTAWFSGEKVPNPRGPDFVDQGGSIRITSKSGKRMYMECGTDQGHGVRVIYGAKYGQIAIDELTGKAVSSCRKSEFQTLPTTRYGMPAEEKEWTIKPADVLEPSQRVIEALLKGENYPTAEQSRLAVATLVCAYISNEQKHRGVLLDEALPRDRKFPWG